MDLMHLGWDYKPDYQFEDFKSLVWTERYREAGEFQLTTHEIEKGRLYLPVRHFVGLLGSREIMIVERHEISKDDDGRALLTIKGRTLEYFFKYRYAWKTHLPADFDKDKPIWDIANRTSAACAKYLIDYLCVNANAWPAGFTSPTLPGLLVQNVATRAMVAKTRRIEPGNLYDILIPMLAEDDLGICNYRPINAETNWYVRIYNGVDRSNSVIFDGTAGHFTDMKYLFSSENYWSTVYGLAKGLRQSAVRYWTGIPAYTTGFGFRDHVIYRDDYVPSIDGSDVSEYTGMLMAELKATIAEKSYVQMMYGEVSPSNPFKYGTHYNLGDIVGAKGDFGIQQDMKVDEYVRIQDETGEREFPTLSSFNEPL